MGNLSFPSSLLSHLLSLPLEAGYSVNLILSPSSQEQSPNMESTDNKTALIYADDHSSSAYTLMEMTEDVLKELMAQELHVSVFSMLMVLLIVPIPC